MARTSAEEVEQQSDSEFEVQMKLNGPAATVSLTLRSGLWPLPFPASNLTLTARVEQRSQPA